MKTKLDVIKEKQVKFMKVITVSMIFTITVLSIAF
jgi:hypothetical protein